MNHNIRYNKVGDRGEVLNMLTTLRSQRGNFTLIDIGAAANPWSQEFITATLDVGACNYGNIHFHGDMNRPAVWVEIANWVSKNGKFDFCVCTHTLEDISNPKLVCEMLGQIALRGFIAVPSKYSECKRHLSVEGPIRGAIHHRWIFNVENGRFVGYPKLSFTEYLSALDDVAEQYSEDNAELSFFWDGLVDFAVVNDDFFPSSQVMFKSYLNLKDVEN